MRRNYVLETDVGELVVWRNRDTAPEVRIFDGGYVAQDHARLAEKLQGGKVVLKRFPDYSSAVSYIKDKIKEVLWIHHITLPVGYNDRYPQERD